MHCRRSTLQLFHCIRIKRISTLMTNARSPRLSNAMLCCAHCAHCTWNVYYLLNRRFFAPLSFRFCFLFSVALSHYSLSFCFCFLPFCTSFHWADVFCSAQSVFWCELGALEVATSARRLNQMWSTAEWNTQHLEKNCYYINLNHLTMVDAAYRGAGAIVSCHMQLMNWVNGKRKLRESNGFARHLKIHLFCTEYWVERWQQTQTHIKGGRWGRLIIIMRLLPLPPRTSTQTIDATAMLSFPDSIQYCREDTMRIDTAHNKYKLISSCLLLTPMPPRNKSPATSISFDLFRLMCDAR